MSISAPPGQPSIIETLSSSFRDGYALAKTNKTLSIIALTISVIGCMTIVVAGWKPGNTFPVVMNAWFFPLYFMLIVLGYCGIAAAVRTVNAEYRMTVAQFFGFVGYGLLVGLLTAIAGVFFIIPAYWVGVKLLLTPYTYVVTNGEPHVLKRTWSMTTGYYWQTVGILLLAGLCFMVITYAAFGICILGAYIALPSIIVLGPLALAALIWLIHVHALIYVRWTQGLLPRSNTPQGAVPVPA